MRRGWKILIGTAVVLAALLAVNTLIVGDQTKPAEANVPGGKILSLTGGDLQVVDSGPRDADPIVLIHCFTCAIDWWDEMMPALERKHRVIAVDLLGFGGSEKPESGYSMEDEAALVAEALSRLDVDDATVVGHSLGGTVATALALGHSDLVERLVIVDQAPNNEDYEAGGLPFTAQLTFVPVIGEGLWQIMPDFAVEDGLGEAFAPGYEVPPEFVEDFRRMTYTSYDEAAMAENDYVQDAPLDRRIREAGIPLLAIFGSDEQIYDSAKALSAYGAIPGAKTVLVEGAGHSPSVEKPAKTAALVLAFARHEMQKPVQDRRAVRNRP
ncbi:MAG TPA: alpha/beta hydrolase [Solirubrobacterales bacterium]|nr:alpha/beta hydrolase [Solirubrobacterales bacterium]